MREEFCESRQCDQYIHSDGGAFAQCLMVQRELSRVGSCPLRYDTVVEKASLEVRAAGSHNEARNESMRKKGSGKRSK